MSTDKDLANIRRALFGSRAQSGSFYAEVKSVDADKRTCVVMDDNEMQYDDVLLYCVENADLKGFVMLPKVNSQVLVSRIGASNELYVSMFSEIDKVILTIGDKVEAAIDKTELNYKNDKVALKITGSNVELNADKLIFNGGDNKGLIKIEQLTAKINAIVDTFNSHVHSGVIIGVSGGSGAPAVGAPGNSAAPTAPATKLNKTDYENDKITH